MKIRDAKVFKSGKTILQNSNDLQEKIDQANALATSIARTNLIAFIETSTDIPRLTGLMASTAVDSLLSSGLGGELDLMVWFNIHYAEQVDDRTHFMRKITPKIQQIVADAIRQAFGSTGLTVTVMV